MAPHRKRQRLSEDGTAAPMDRPLSDADQDTSSIVKPVTQDVEKQRRRTLFVRALPSTTTTADLTELFSQSYPIKHATAVIDPATKQCKGYGFVTFADAEDAQKAVDEFNGSAFQGRKLRVEVAEPRNRAELIPGTERRDKSVPAAAAREVKAARAREHKQEHQSPKLIIRNLPWSIKDPEQLADLFRSYGKIKYAVLPQKGGIMAGFGIIVLRGRKNAEKALEGVNGRKIDGRTLAVDWAVDKDTWHKLHNGVDEHESALKQSEPLQEKNSTGPDTMDTGTVLPECESDIEDETADEVSSVEGEDSDSVISGSEDVTTVSDNGTQKPRAHDDSATLFIRNLPFTCSDETLHEHFSQFGGVRYARIVVDHVTERPKGTGFVCFYSPSDAETCLRSAPRVKIEQNPSTAKKEALAQSANSILQDENADPTGQFTMDGRILHVSRAVSKSEAARLTEEGVQHRDTRDKDKRRLFLLSEGTVPSNSALHSKLAPSEIKMREASTKQRKTLVQSNPSLHLSLTRLAVRNIPRSTTTKDLKALAREAVVGFAKDVKSGTRQPLSKEELNRGGEDMKQAEKERKTKGKGIVKQAKIVYEGSEGAKVSERGGAGRSRGYGFIEYYTHRSALMGLRWLNGHSISYSARENKGSKASHEEPQDRKRRLIVEFAIENAQVVSRRNEKEVNTQNRVKSNANARKTADNHSVGPQRAKDSSFSETPTSRKRKTISDEDRPNSVAQQDPNSSSGVPNRNRDEKLAKRQKIIARKRMIRRSRKAKAST